MNGNGYTSETLSPWWKNTVIIVIIAGFSVLLWLAVRAHKDAPPVPEQVVHPAGVVVMTGNDIRAGHEVFLESGLMENGTAWGPGGSLGPDFYDE